MADAGTAFPTDLVAVDVATLANAGMVTVGVADLANAGIAGAGTVDVSDLAEAGRVLPADLVVLATESGGDIVMWGDHTSSGVWRRAGTPSRSDVDCQYVGCVGCVPVSVHCAAPAAGCSGSLMTW